MLDEKIATIIKEIMGVDINVVDKKKKLSTISEWDSFNNLMLISRLQDEFKIEFTAAEIETTQTISDLFELMHKKIK